MKKEHSAKHHMKEAKKHGKHVEHHHKHAEHHHKKEKHHMEMAHKAMGKIGSVAEEKKMAKKGDKKGSMYGAK